MEENDDEKEHDESEPLLDKGTDSSASDDYESLGVSKKPAEENPLDKKTMKPWLFWTITVLVTVFVCMYTGIEGTYGGLLATYATEVGATSTAGAAYMTSCT